MDQDVLAHVLRLVADDLQGETDHASLAQPPAVATEDAVQYAIASAFRRVADQLMS